MPTRGDQKPETYFWALTLNSLDNKGSCWILLDFYCSVTILRELGLITQYKCTLLITQYKCTLLTQTP